MTLATTGTVVDVAFIIVTLVALFFCVRPWAGSAGATTSERVLVRFTPLAGVICGRLILRQVLDAPFWDRNASRLVGIFSIKFGFPLYHPLDAGPLVSTSYPPLSSLAFAPSCIFNEPTIAILSAALLNALYLFVPVLVLLFFSKMERRQGWAVPTSLFLVFVFMAYESDSLRYVAFRIHADAPALGLSLLSAFALFGYLKNERNWSLGLSAMFLVLSLWTKQTVIPLVVALPIILLFCGMRKSFCLHLGWMALCSTLAVITALVFVNVPVMMQNIFVHRFVGWSSTVVEAFTQAFGELLRESLWTLIPMVLVFSHHLGKTKNEVRRLVVLRSLLKDNMSVLLFWLGVAMIPMALANKATIGGDHNALALTVYFWSVGAMVALRSLASSGSRVLSEGAKAALATLVVVLSLVHLPSLFLYRFSSMVEGLERNPQEVSYRYLQQHHGRAYFPWNPLSHLLAEKKLYHFDPAVIDHLSAGFELSHERFNNYIPSELELVAIHKGNDYSKYVTPRLIEGLTRIQRYPDLPDWNVYIKRNDH